MTRRAFSYKGFKVIRGQGELVATQKVIRRAFSCKGFRVIRGQAGLVLNISRNQLLEIFGPQTVKSEKSDCSFESAVFLRVSCHFNPD